MSMGIALCVLLAASVPYGAGYVKRTFKSNRAAALTPVLLFMVALTTVILLWGRLA